MVPSFSFTWNNLSFKYDSNVCSMHREGFFWFGGRVLGAIFYQMLLWYRGTPQSNIIIFSNVPFMISVILCTCSMVKCCCQNTNWWPGRIRFSSNIECNLLSIALFGDFARYWQYWLIYMSRLPLAGYQVSESLWSAQLSIELGSVLF
jgi:hypothetical protein